MKNTTDKQVNAFTKWELQPFGRNAFIKMLYNVTEGKNMGIIDFSYFDHPLEDVKEWYELIASAPAMKAENEKLKDDIEILKETLKMCKEDYQGFWDAKDKNSSTAITVNKITEVLNQTK